MVLQEDKNWSLQYEVTCYNSIPAYLYVSKKTKMSVFIAQVDGPLVNGYFCLATEAHDDDGLPHTLEHLTFLGSHTYPYKGVLDLMANKCFSAGTNAWTDVDHTCYTASTAGAEGFLRLLPVYIDHILYPTLTDEAFVTEVYHVNDSNEDGGVVYCEMQSIENEDKNLVYRAMATALYTKKSGYSAETGGRVENLRNSTNNEKIRKYHKTFYRPENLMLIIAGKVDVNEVLNSLAEIEDKICQQGNCGEWKKPWRSPVPPLVESQNLKVLFPADEEDAALVAFGWRGPRCDEPDEYYRHTALAILLKYLTESTVSPLQKEFIQNADPCASTVDIHVMENIETALFIQFEDVQLEKVEYLRERCPAFLRQLVDKEDIDTVRMDTVLRRFELESEIHVEVDPHSSVACAAIAGMLYGNSKEMMQKRLNPQEVVGKLKKEPKQFWVDLLRKYMVDAPCVVITGLPSTEEKDRLAKVDQERLVKRETELGKNGLQEKGNTLKAALEYNSRPVPPEIISSVPIPSLESIPFLKIERFDSDSKSYSLVNLTDSPVFTYFDHVPDSNFIHATLMMDTVDLTLEERFYLPLTMLCIFESPMLRNGKLLTYEEVATVIEEDSISHKPQIGISDCSDFRTGRFGNLATIGLQLEESKLATGLEWLRDAINSIQLDLNRVVVLAMQTASYVAQLKRRGDLLVDALISSMYFKKDSNQYCNSLLRQLHILSDVITSLEDEKKGETVLATINGILKKLSQPRNLSIHLAGNYEHVPVCDMIPSKLELLLPTTAAPLQRRPPNYMDRAFMDQSFGGKHVVLHLGTSEGSYLSLQGPGIADFVDPRRPALMLACRYLSQLEGPLWINVRGRGLTYGVHLRNLTDKGVVEFSLYRSTNVFEAFKETKRIVEECVACGEIDQNLLDSARSSLIFSLIEKEKVTASIIEESLTYHLMGTDFSYKRKFLKQICSVTASEMIEALNRYVLPLFKNVEATNLAVVVPTAKANEICDQFTGLGYDTKLHTLDTCSLNKGFLKCDDN